MQNAFPISSMAFADNLVLISESLTEIKSLLKRTETFMYVSTWDEDQPPEVILNGPQGSVVEKAALYCNRTISPSGNIDLPTLGPSGYTRYLGVQFDAGGIGKVPAEQGKCDKTCLVGSA